MSGKPAIILIIGCLVLYGAVTQAKLVNVTGDWELTMGSLLAGQGGGAPGGLTRGTVPPGSGDRQQMVVTFVQKGEDLEARMTNPAGKEMKGTGKVVRNEIEFTFTMSGGPEGDMTIVHKGKVDGDTMKGTVAMGDTSVREWTAKRVVKK